ncbi:MAG TPA: MBL fold metallo-hydrolase [Devosiaceae bacterium]|nr:MBL fold metallo-hydrolase [Devosiaceae bacterium]
MSGAGGLEHETGFDARPGEPVEAGPGVVRLTAPNPGPYTLAGTNTYLIGDSRIAIVDPGPRNEAHLEALTEAIADRKVEAIVLTHTHADHAGLARIVQNRVDAPLLFEGGYRPLRALERFEIDRARRHHLIMDPDFVLQDTDTIRLDGSALKVVTTPGHCANHICLSVAGTPFLLTGDHVMGWSSSVIADPEGAVAPYLDALDRLQTLSQTRYLPGHGGEIADGKARAAALKAHRQARNAQILEALGAGPARPRELVAKVYPGLSDKLRPAALATLSAHLWHLADAGKVRRQRAGWMGIGERWELAGAAEAVT